ncbi:MAG TPA: type 4a pilus biogenesis protein PilO, partial [Methylomirabilota bacterium]|nr:type 4a pilus biogenesis protein PilO [Methylomirabilota bacterium]
MAIYDPLLALPKPQKIAIGVIGLVAVGALSFFLLIQPKWDERDALWNRNETLRAKVVQARADEANLRPFRVQAAALRKRLEAAQERLPLEREVPRLYRQVSDLAVQSGLGLALFQPRAPEEKAVLTELPIAVISESGYHQLGVFFDKVGRLPRIVNLGDFRMSGIERATGSVRAELTLTTYVFRPEGAPPPGAKPGQPGQPA